MHHKTNLIPFWNAVGKYGLRDSKHWQNKIKAIYSLNDHVHVRGFMAYILTYIKMNLSYPANR